MLEIKGSTGFKPMTTAFTKCPMTGRFTLPNFRAFALLFLCLGWQKVAANLIISEVMYHPPKALEESLGQSLEFIELYNHGDQAMTLDGMAFVEGILFDFPAGILLEPNSYLVVAKNAQAIRTHYGITNVVGDYQGSLDNTGEMIRLVDAFGEGRIRFRYGRSGSWPASADGAGDSLVRQDPEGDNDDAASWGHSFLIGGSPGKAEPARGQDPTLRRLVQNGSPGHYFKGIKEPSPGSTDWTKPAFVQDGDWLAGRSGYGYSNNEAERSQLTTLLDDMRNAYLSVYARIPFEILPQDLETLNTLTLTMHYDDGFVAYLNGVRVGSQGVSGNPPAFDQAASAGSDYDPVTLNLTGQSSLLVAGTNWLCVQGHNVGIGNSSDFILSPQLDLELEPTPSVEFQQRALVINEIASNRSLQPDFIEIHNPTSEAINMGGMWLSDKSEALGLFEIPAGTIIEPHGFHVIECGIDTTGFGLSSSGESIYLSGSDLKFVASSMHYGPLEIDGSIARFPDGSSDWFHQKAPTPGLPNERHRHGPVLLNEIMYHPLNEQGAEFIELHNLQSDSITLENWSLIGVNHRFGKADNLSPLGYGVITDDTERFLANYEEATLSLIDQYRGRLSNSGEPIGLLDAYGIHVDWINLVDSPPWPISADGLGASVERACWSDQLNQPQEWSGSPLGMPSPGAANHLTDCPPVTSGGVVIAEVLYHPTIEAMDPSLMEFIKLQNTTDRTLSLAGWMIAGSVFHLMEEGTSLAPGAHLTLATSPEHLASVRPFEGNIHPIALEGTLPNSGGELVLLNQDGQLVDQMVYDDDAPWPSLADGFAGDQFLGHSLLRLCDTASGTLASNWVAQSNPTPHLPQLSWQCELLSRPAGLQVTPTLVSANQSPRIEVNWTAQSQVDLIDTVQLEYFIDDAEIENEPIRFLSMQAEILSSGMEHRENWWVTMPSLPANSLVRYRIRTLTSTGGTYLSPAPDQDAMAWHAYFVDPGIPHGKPYQHHLFIASSQWRQLHSNTAAGRVSGGQPNPTWNNEVPATFVSDGKVIDVTVRNQGSRWNRNGGQNISFGCPSHQSNQAQVRSWRIRFPSYRNLEGIDTLLLQKQSGWPQRVSFKMFELAGVAAPKTSWADLQINGCAFNGDAFQIERPGSEMVDRFFGPVGDLFKSQGFTGDEGPWSWGDARLIRGSRSGFSQSDRYEYTYNRKTLNWLGQPGDSSPDIVEPMIQALHQARDAGREALREWLSDHFDVERTLRYICTINYVGTFDDMFQNHYLYRKAEDQKWCMFPWDMDNTLGGSFGEWNANPFRGADESRIGNVGNRSGWWHRIKDSFFIAFEQEFLTTFYQLNNTVHSPEALRPVIDSIAAEGGYQNSVASLMNHIQRRHDYLNDFIEPGLAPPAIHLERTPSAVEISWDSGRVDYRLESSPNPNGPWSDLQINPQQVQPTPTSFRILPKQHQLFFRLTKD